MEGKRTPQGRVCPLLQRLCVGEDCAWYLRRGCAVLATVALQAVGLREQKRSASGASE